MNQSLGPLLWSFPCPCEVPFLWLLFLRMPLSLLLTYPSTFPSGFPLCRSGCTNVLLHSLFRGRRASVLSTLRLPSTPIGRRFLHLVYSALPKLTVLLFASVFSAPLYFPAPLRSSDSYPPSFRNGRVFRPLFPAACLRYYGCSELCRRWPRRQVSLPSSQSLCAAIAPPPTWSPCAHASCHVLVALLSDLAASLDFASFHQARQVAPCRYRVHLRCALARSPRTALHGSIAAPLLSPASPVFMSFCG